MGIANEYINRGTAIDAVTAEALERNLDSLMTDDASRYHRAAARVLAGIPAADVRPVVRGKWVESKSMMEVVYCSECGFRTIYGAMPDGLGRNYSYCPNCGADMREEHDNG